MAVESPPLDPCRLQLQRVLESESFRTSDSLRRLLSYVAERSLNHTADDLKEYVIGVDVFGKPPSYDPQKDASVRVQISRLRQQIDEYYKGEGSGNPSRLVLPKGHFTIRFEPRQSEAAPGSQHADPAPAGAGSACWEPGAASLCRGSKRIVKCPLGSTRREGFPLPSPL